ncbi:DUF1214 domain-containing protein [Paraburkholderia sp. PGU19]|uniref:DUF1214 domain-containing protein n=1 Tax=Paraburkholderia sp. PGU19 TaxID=2735434 RepID=UPI0031F98844
MALTRKRLLPFGAGRFSIRAWVAHWLKIRLALLSDPRCLSRRSDFVLRDIYFGPKAPAGKEANWVQTVPDKGYLMILRLYSPKGAFFNQTWRPDDLERIAQ